MLIKYEIIMQAIYHHIIKIKINYDYYSYKLNIYIYLYNLY